MDRKNRPEGRKKRIGTGQTGVHRRVSASSGNRSRVPTKSVPLIVIVIAVIVISRLGGGNLGGFLDSSPSQTASPIVTQDRGAYPVNTSVSEFARDKRTVLAGNGVDTATIMIYLCGTDLEARSGMATSDLLEIINANISDKVNIIVETGGTSRWQNNAINPATNQRYRVTGEGLILLQDNLGKKSMVNSDTLSDFIRYSKKNFPADRYVLILWDHGGGALAGYGYDQHFPNDAMTLDEIAVALKNGGCSFDWIGFDACLMATFETAVALEPYADYMIASEEVEPGIGWHYTGWVTALSRNPSIPTVELGKKLIDDYVAEVKVRVPQSQATLSLIDLAELKGTVPEAFTKFAKSTSRLIDTHQYKVVSNARAGTKEFSPSSGINHVDLIHFAENLGTTEAASLAEALKGSVKYNRTSANISNSNGISIFFPYGNTKQLNSMLNTYDKIGIDSEYSECIKNFGTLTAAGQVTSPSSGNPLGMLLGGLGGSGQSVETLLTSFLSGGDFSSITGLVGGNLGNWLDIDRIRASASYLEENRLDVSQLVITKKDGQRVLALTEDQWDMVQFMEMNVFIDDGEGFIDLGLDNVYEYNDSGDLIMEYDGTWLALNGHIVSYYMISDDHAGDSYSIKGRVPALLNGQQVDIIIVFDDETPYGSVLGAQLKYDTESETETIPKGLLAIETGDKIDFLCNYYTYEGEFNDTYFLGDTLTATGTWQIENLSITNLTFKMAYRITDIYGNRYWTPTIS